MKFLTHYLVPALVVPQMVQGAAIDVAPEGKELVPRTSCPGGTTIVYTYKGNDFCIGNVAAAGGAVFVLGYYVAPALINAWKGNSCNTPDISNLPASKPDDDHEEEVDWNVPSDHTSGNSTSIDRPDINNERYMRVIQTNGAFGGECKTALSTSDYQKIVQQGSRDMKEQGYACAIFYLVGAGGYIAKFKFEVVDTKGNIYSSC